MPDQQQNKIEWTPIACLAAALIAVVVIAMGPGDAMTHLRVAVGYLTLVLVFFFGLMILVAMARNKIDLGGLVNEDNGRASMARFQLLIFTFVISLSLFMMVVSMIVSNKEPNFPKIPAEILTLLGISATTYGAGKALQPAIEEAKKTATVETRTDAAARTPVGDVEEHKVEIKKEEPKA